VVIAIGTEAQFEKFCRFVGREDLLHHPHYLRNEVRVRHRDEVMAEMNKIIGTKSRTYWIENLEKVGVPTGPVNTLKEAFQDPQIQTRKVEQAFGDELKTVASPLHLLGAPPVYVRRPPRLGEHTEEVLSAFLSTEQLEELRQKGIV
jgi:crotonobetainyl-CoA:carnitine CoA-transferase CaiB-like acyl-CoA transferase